MGVEEMKKKGKKATLVQKENLKKYLEKNILAGEVVITLGAGNIYDIYHELETDVPVLVATETLVK
jgi:UDP-N-acetylmuramate-alanine ligase